MNTRYATLYIQVFFMLYSSGLWANNSCEDTAIWRKWTNGEYHGANVMLNLNKTDWDILRNSWHVNSVRLQLILKDDQLQLLSKGGLDALPRLRGKLKLFFESADNAKIDVIVDLHRVEGGAVGDKAKLWKSPQLRENYKKVWAILAKELKQYPNLAGFDLLNEPTPVGVYTKAYYQRKGTDEDWMVLAKSVLDEIRKHNSCVPIIIESVDWAKPFRFNEMVVFDDERVVYSAHMYSPISFTHQGINQFPKGFKLDDALVNGNRLNDYVKTGMKEVRKFQCKYHKPIYIGEFGVNFYADSDERIKYINTLIDVFSEYGWSWSYHAYQIWEGWMPSSATLESIARSAKRTKNIKVECK